MADYKSINRGLQANLRRFRAESRRIDRRRGIGINPSSNRKRKKSVSPGNQVENQNGGQRNRSTVPLDQNVDRSQEKGTGNIGPVTDRSGGG